MKEDILQALERFNAGDLDDYLQIYSDDVVAHGVAPQPLHGQAAVRAFYTAILAAFSPCVITSHDLISEDDRVACRFSMGGNHTGEFMGLAATGRSFEVDGITILRFSGRKCVERWSKLDMYGLMAQLG